MADDIHDDTDSADLVGQPTGAHSLGLCGAGEGKAWKQDRARFPGVNDGKKQRLDVPKVQGDSSKDGVFIMDYAIVVGPRGGKRRVAVGGIPLHEHPLTQANLAKAYADFAATCTDPEIARYAKVQAMAKSPQADGKGNQFAAYRDRPFKQRKEPDHERSLEGGPEVEVGVYIAMHGQDCMCFDCLVKR